MRDLRAYWRSRGWLLAVILAAGCGGNTSWYFCTGDEEFCSQFRNTTATDSGEGSTQSPPAKPTAGGTALAIARKTPQLVEQGLAADRLETLVRESPETVGAWLLLAIVGLLVDDSDNLAATRFFDQNRYWLAGDWRLPDGEVVLAAGLDALAVAARDRDPAIAEQAKRLSAAAFAEHDFTAGPTPDLVAILLGPAQIELAGSCCSQRVLAAGVVQLCTAVRFDELTESAQNAIAAACQVAAGWLEEIESRVLPAGSERPG